MNETKGKRKKERKRKRKKGGEENLNSSAGKSA